MIGMTVSDHDFLPHAFLLIAKSHVHGDVFGLDGSMMLMVGTLLENDCL